jgi:hypothetical protein
MTKAEMIQQYEAPNLDNDLGRLTAEQIADQQRFASRANAAADFVRRNGLPAGYVESVKEINDILKENAAGAINIEDTYVLDTEVNKTIWDSDVFSQMGLPSFVMSKPRFKVKDYLTTSMEWPRFTTKFRNPQFIQLSDDHGFTNGIGLQMGISIPFTEIVESSGALWSPRAIMMQEAATKMGLQKSRRGFLGDNCQNAYWDDGTSATRGITGLFNYGSVQSHHAGDGDAIITTQGDIEVGLRNAFTNLKKVYQPGKFYIVSTSGFASEMFIHRDTYTQTLDSVRNKEIISIINKYAKGGQWGGWWVTEQLYNTTPAVGKQQIMLFKSSPSLIRRLYVYPQQTLPMLNKMYERDIQENMIFGDILQIKKVDTTNNAVPITVDADCTSATTGFIPDGTRIF